MRQEVLMRDEKRWKERIYMKISMQIIILHKDVWVEKSLSGGGAS